MWLSIRGGGGKRKMKLRFLYKRISWPGERLSAPQEGVFSMQVCVL
jgi:hypothetical protein